MRLREYLHRQCRPSTAATYLRYIGDLKAYLGAKKARKATYGEVMEYVGHLRARYPNPATIQHHLNSLKHYYRYLIIRGVRSDHPCRYVKLQDVPQWQARHRELFSPEELERLLAAPRHPEKLRLRNKTIVSLLIYQGLLKSELLTLGTGDLDLEKGKVGVRGTYRTQRRTLPLQASQVMLLYRYLQEERPALMAAGGMEDHKRLIVSRRGKPGGGIIIQHLVAGLQKVVPHKKVTAYRIRQSVMANMLKVGKDVRLVQAFAGHKWPDSTQRYKPGGIEELKSQIDKYHPLGDEASA